MAVSAGHVYRMNHVTVSLDGRPLGSPITATALNTPTKFDVPLSPPQTAQVVTVARQDSHRTHRDTYTYLNLCEVQVWGKWSFAMFKCYIYKYCGIPTVTTLVEVTKYD